MALTIDPEYCLPELCIQPGSDLIHRGSGMRFTLPVAPHELVDAWLMRFDEIDEDGQRTTPDVLLQQVGEDDPVEVSDEGSPLFALLSGEQEVAVADPRPPGAMPVGRSGSCSAGSGRCSRG